MPGRAFLDSNVFIFGFERPYSNSRKILDLLAAGRFEGVVTDRVVREVIAYMRRHHGKDRAALFRDFILLTCDLLVEADLRIGRELIDLAGPKDAGAVAAVRETGLASLVSTDSDFARVPEHRTPGAFVVELGKRARPGEE